MKQVIRKALKALNGKEKRRFLVLTVYHMAISVADIAALALLVGLIAFFTQETPGYLKRFIPGDVLASNPAGLFLILVLLFALKNYAGFAANRAQCRFMAEVASRISHDTLFKYLHGNYRAFVSVDSAVHIRETSYNPIEFSQHILNGTQQIIGQSVIVLLAVTGILLFNVQLFVLLFLILLPPVILVFFRLKQRAAAASAQAKRGSERSLKFLQEALEGFIESNLYQRTEYFLKRYAAEQQAFNRSIADYLLLQEIPPRVIETVALAGLFLLIVFARTVAGDPGLILTIGAFMAAAYKIIPGCVKILNISGQINAYSYTLKQRIPVGIPEGERKGSPVPEKVQSVVFENVAFGYQEGLLLNGLNLRLAPGDFMGIAGPSGRGKTTILHLLLGFLEPGNGRIMVNGVETTLQQRQAYRRHIAYVKQQPFVIQGSLTENVLLGETNCDRRKLEHVLEVSGLKETFGVLGAGQDKMIAERGRNISGGQRQRIAFARAIYKDAPLLILDEPFSELDEASEQTLLRYLGVLSGQGKIILLISHHLNSISFCNKTLKLHA